MSTCHLPPHAALSGKIPPRSAAPTRQVPGPLPSSLRPPVSSKAVVGATWAPFTPASSLANPQAAPVTRVVDAAAAAAAPYDPPPVADTKAAFLQAYSLPIPSIYNTVIQELLVQQHITRYTRSYKYDPVFALGFVTVFDQLMDGYPSPDQREIIFTAYIQALQEDPAKYRADAERLEKWAADLPSASSLVDFGSREGEVEAELKGIAQRAQSGSKDFHYSRFFAVGLFRLLELAKASDPTVLQQLCEALGVNKLSVNRDLDVYRGLLSKLTQAKELLRDFLQREKGKKAARQDKAGEREKETAEVKSE